MPELGGILDGAIASPFRPGSATPKAETAGNRTAAWGRGSNSRGKLYASVRAVRIAAFTVALAAAGGTARADGAEPRLIPTTPAPSDHAIGLSHVGQFQVSLRLALGLRAIATYHNEFCGQANSTASDGNSGVCTGRAPFSLDFEAGYGIARNIDGLVEFRVGIEQDFGATPTASDGGRVFHISPGVRLFFSDIRRIKLFTTAQFVIDASGYKNLAGDRLATDFGVRNLSGLWIDLDRAYGFYAFVGETATFARWLRLELEAGFGVQGRYR